jgi:serine phosphatase RsbU (regulator of sigma subunit)
VCGRGIDAAALTGVTRHTIRAAARHLRSAEEVLRWTHQAILTYGSDTYCTACFAFLDVDDDGSACLELALGGHPQPLLVGADAHVTPVGHHGTVLGMIEPRLFTTVHTLATGDLLVLYTDGITDAPEGQSVSIDELAAVVAAHRDAPLADIADQIGAVTEARRVGRDRDDTALLILRLASAVEAPPDRAEPPMVDAEVRR